MKNEQLLNNLIEKKAQLEKELAAINEMIKLEEAKAAAPTAAPTAEKIEDATVEVKVTEKETSKGTEYTYTYKINGSKEYTRKSKKRYTMIILFEHQGRVGFEGFSSSEKSARSAAKGWERVGGKGRVFTI